jgi:hypothetical protein
LAFQGPISKSTAMPDQGIVFLFLGGSSPWPQPQGLCSVGKHRKSKRSALRFLVSFDTKRRLK